MMDDRDFERLSRYIDDDLSATERTALEEEISLRPDLQSALSDLRTIRGRVRQLAENDSPPESLDSLVRPLRRGGRPQLRQSAFVPIAAAAAVVVIAVVLGLEIGRYEPLPQISGPQEKPTAFALKALPEADDSSLVGALEHLMDMPYPEPDMPEPEALEAIGPLPAPPEYYRRRLVLEVGSLDVPLPPAGYPVGLELEITIVGGRLAGCRAVGEDVEDARDLCTALADAAPFAIGDGNHRATVIVAR